MQPISANDNVSFFIYGLSAVRVSADSSDAAVLVQDSGDRKPLPQLDAGADSGIDQNFV